MDHKKYLGRIGARGGAVKSDRKAEASRANGRKGGRPRTIKPQIQNEKDLRSV